MDTADRLELATRHTLEVIEEEELQALFDEGTPSAYIGYAPTGEMHIGHYTTMRKLADFIEAGIDVTVLIADLHAHLDDEKSPFDLLDARSEYYQVAIEGMIEAAGADPEAISFVRGTDFQLDEEYTLEMYRMAAETTLARTQRAGSRVVRESESPNLGGLIYPLMQTLDVKALDADIAYGGDDQRGIYMLSRETLPDHGHDAPVCIFAPLLSGLTGEEMSASKEDTKVNLNDSHDAVVEKIEDAYCPMGEREDNGVLEYLEYLVFPVLEERGESFVVERPDEYGGNLVYDEFDELEADFLSEELHPADLKPAAGEYVSDVIGPIRERLDARPELLAEAYPEKYDQ
ncbi:tyrosine--tRNA ligase [Halomicrobium sp. IBSBa]|uniref:tyrosine--tRNA ligase n=1 Tax=Halomicrobium sp. IBSBa TaxID=2778916 RepID=UPI001ABFB6B0|nr:tyrosine--tRNA ligase [Halomicrobium sp. IBSBa]MBO4246377.1 tyrosine--tRNA ligase [Halomicrobium sp. IBSBa]